MWGTSHSRENLSILPSLATPNISTISQIIDTIVANSEKRTLPSSIELSFINRIERSKTYCFLYNEKSHCLFCSSLFRFVPLENSIVASVFNKKEVFFCDNPLSCPDFNISVDPCATNEQSAFVPLLDANENCKGVVVICKRGAFLDKEKYRLVRFPKRFSYYLDPLVKMEKRYQGPSNLSLDALKDHFGAMNVEMFKVEDGKRFRFSKDSGDFEEIIYLGSADEAFKTGSQVTLVNVKSSSSYVPGVDGSEDESVLIQPFDVGRTRYAYVLRGKTNGSTFSTLDGIKMEAIAPLIASEMYNLKRGDCDNEHLGIMSERLQALLQVAEAIFGVLDLDSLLPTIMDKACSLLNTERCSLFIVDKQTNELVTRFHGGLDKAIRVKMGVGIAGYTAQTGKCVNINDAYKDARFDVTVDKNTGFTTKTILTVPIYDNRGAIAGVTEMINRKDGMSFDDEDIQMMKTFNVFCGISLDNANLYNTSLQLMKEIHGFIEASAAIGKEESIDKVLKEIIETMKTIVNGKFAAVFSYDNETETITKIASTGHPLDSNTSYVEVAIKAREQKAFLIEQKTQNEEEAKTKPTRTFSAKIKFDAIESATESNDQMYVKKIVCFPLLASDNEMLGAIEVGTNNLILTEDLKLLSCFSVFAALSLEKERLKEVASIGKAEMRLKSFIKDNEGGVGDIPSFLKIEPSKQATIFSIDFDAPRWDGVGHFRVLFHIMNEFQLLQTFKIRNETFLHFINEISQSYKKVPYHNWRHAVDVTQFVAYQVKLTKLDLSLTKIQLFCLFIAAICHDVNHDGFTNVFNEKAETPLGILFKNQSVMETHHCQVAINISTKEDCNIFSNFDSNVYKICWQTIIDLILATDMAKHHSSLQKANQILDKGPLDMHNDDDKLMVMQLLLKCGDISNVSRPFELADKWCDVLCEEFFRQGDLEKTNGMEYTSPLNDRSHLDKPKSQIGFYTFVCLPLFQTAARALPALQVNVDQINSNLAVWKSRIEENM